MVLQSDPVCLEQCVQQTGLRRGMSYNANTPKEKGIRYRLRSVSLLLLTNRVSHLIHTGCWDSVRLRRCPNSTTAKPGRRCSCSVPAVGVSKVAMLASVYKLVRRRLVLAARQLSAGQCDEVLIYWTISVGSVFLM